MVTRKRYPSQAFVLSHRYYPGAPNIAHPLLDTLILPDICTTVIHGVVSIEDLHSVVLFLHICLQAVSSRTGLSGTVAVSAHTGAAPRLMTTNKIGCWGDARGSALAAAVLIVWSEKTSGFAMAAVVIGGVVNGAELADVSVHAYVAVGLGVLVAHGERARLNFRLDGALIFILRIVGEVETFNGSSTLVADVADDVGNGIGLVSKMTIGNVRHAEAIARGIAGKW